MLDHDCSASDALLLLAPEDRSAILEGRLFVEGRRIRRADDGLRMGDTVVWNAPRGVERAHDSSTELVIECREGLVAASKPAAWSSEPDRTGTTTSLREKLASRLRVKALHIATRLDVGVSGLVIAATNVETQRHLAKIVGSSECHRSYVAIAAGACPDRGQWRGSVEVPLSARARDATTNFECIAHVALGRTSGSRGTSDIDTVSLLLLRPETGRRHQLRIHCSRAGLPVLGDRRYGGPARFTDAEGRVTPIERILLHALAATVPLPSGGCWQPCCPIPEDFREVWQLLGGSVEDLVRIQA